MSIRPTRRLLLGLVLSAFAAVPATATAQSYPAKPVKMMVGFAPGGPTDILARLVATAMSKSLGQNVIVENRAGAAGALAAQALAKAEPDGYTILFAGDGQLTLLPQLSPNAGYQTLQDMAPLRTVAGQSNVLMAHKSSGIVDMPSLLRQARATPRTVSYGSAGNGTPSHLVGALFESTAGIELLHVPYKGAGPAMTDLLGGTLKIMFVGMPVAVQNATREQLAPIAVTGNKRSPRLPQVPTFGELGFQGLGDEVDVWWAVTAPAGTPPQVRSRLDAAIQAALADATLRESFNAQGVELLDRDAQATRARIESDQARWGRLIQSGKVPAQ
ncbi:tripartite tricarboxylate transporter substrate binding protein [Ramlibacter sp. AW1]|uniref:Tripartite tricarboxylate transporter substrate binding protein n=1 Tax=Ramlibacter aurantiacus TaxID=2801330 RepID=A0A937D4E7_9BURK|nr:tripartite tricarboxylate transporter substrate-binding protein [Ramlibacter aurantiacus]MBL0421655.1 tripartite tricarboxylate transporter substrate binding protein [Ramlibacter aurantiacus]